MICHKAGKLKFTGLRIKGQTYAGDSFRGWKNPYTITDQLTLELSVRSANASECGNLKPLGTNGNSVLVYGPSHAQLAAETISNQILAPTVVPFDSSGNLAIANAGDNSIVEYTPAGNPSTVIADRISLPFAIAFDALDDL